MRRAIQEDQPQQLCGVAHLPSALKRAKLTRRRIQISNLGKTGDNGRPPAVLERCCLHLPLESHPLEPVQSLRFAPMGLCPGPAKGTALGTTLWGLGGKEGPARWCQHPRRPLLPTQTL